MKIKVYDNLNYHILSAKTPFSDLERSHLDEAFKLWLEIWEEVYSNPGSGFVLTSDDFLRQDLITVISDKARPVALHLYSFFDLESLPAQRSKYLQFFDSDYLQTLTPRGVTKVMSMEYLTVHPDYRKSKLGLSLVQTIAELGCRIFEGSSVGALVAPARNDLKVNQAAYDIGARCIKKDTVQRGFTCDLIAWFKGDSKRGSDAQASELAKNLWNQRHIFPSAQKYFETFTGPVVTEIKANVSGHDLVRDGLGQITA